MEKKEQGEFISMKKSNYERHGNIEIYRTDGLIKSDRRWKIFYFLVGRGDKLVYANNQIADSLKGKVIKVLIRIIGVFLAAIAAATFLEYKFDLPEPFAKIAHSLSSGDLTIFSIVLLCTVILLGLWFILKVSVFLGACLGFMGFIGAISTFITIACLVFEKNCAEWFSLSNNKFLNKLQFVDWDYYMHIFLIISTALIVIAIAQTIVCKIVEKSYEISSNISCRLQEKAAQKAFLKEARKQK